MENKLQALLDQVRELEKEVVQDLAAKREQFHYDIRDKQILFEEAARLHHLRVKKHIFRYLIEARPFNIITAPFIWSLLVPALWMDLSVTIYQAICFPAYRIPKVPRGDYVKLDRRFLPYLNTIEKINCWYCSYINGVLSYWREVAGRTEQYWCPIKHATTPKAFHSRYPQFMDYGDSHDIHDRWETLRKRFKDLREVKAEPGNGSWNV